MKENGYLIIPVMLVLIFGLIFILGSDEARTMATALVVLIIGVLIGYSANCRDTGEDF